MKITIEFTGEDQVELRPAIEMVATAIKELKLSVAQAAEAKPKRRAKRR